MMMRAIVPFVFLAFAYSQTPLETLAIEGSELPEKTILELSGSPHWSIYRSRGDRGRMQKTGGDGTLFIDKFSL